MAAMLFTLIPPVVIVLAMQRAFVRGLVTVRNKMAGFKTTGSNRKAGTAKPVSFNR